MLEAEPPLKVKDKFIYGQLLYLLCFEQVLYNLVAIGRKRTLYRINNIYKIKPDRSSRRRRTYKHYIYKDKKGLGYPPPTAVRGQNERRRRKRLPVISIRPILLINCVQGLCRKHAKIIQFLQKPFVERPKYYKYDPEFVAQTPKIYK